MKYMISLGILLLILIDCSSNDATLPPNAPPQQKIIGRWKRDDDGSVRKYTPYGAVVPDP